MRLLLDDLVFSVMDFFINQSFELSKDQSLLLLELMVVMNRKRILHSVAERGIETEYVHHSA